MQRDVVLLKRSFFQNVNIFLKLSLDLVRSRFSFLELLGGGLRDLLTDFDSLLLLDTDLERFFRESRVDRFSSFEERSRFFEEYSLVLELFRAGGGDSVGDRRERRFDVRGQF